MKVCVLALIISCTASAGMVSPLMSEGVVKSFNEEEVTLIDAQGVSFKVPRSTIEKKYKLHQGLRVTVYSLAPKATNKK